MKSKVWIWIILIVVILGIFYVLRARKAEVTTVEPKTAATKPTAKKKWLIGFSQSTMIDPWRINMLKQMQDAVEEHKDEIDFIYTDAKNDNNKQIADVQDLVTRGIDLLIISPREAEPLTPIVSEVYRKGIPVITLDRNITTSDYTCFIGASNLEIGRKAGERMVKELGGKGVVVEIEGILGATPTIERSKGFHEVVDKYKDIKVVLKRPADYLREPARKIMEDALQAFKKIDGVYAHNDEMALGALAAAKAVGKDKGLVIIGIDGQKEAFKAIMRGEMTATYIYPNGSKEAIETALKILKGEKVPKHISLPTVEVTKENVEKYYDPNAYF
ncbi:substrate-binding domain-containing protein [bacterium]|nr:substrate-binding domain-containing protein [bacterium]